MFDVRNCPLPSPSTRTGGRSLDLIGVSQATSAMSDRVGMGGRGGGLGGAPPGSINGDTLR